MKSGPALPCTRSRPSFSRVCVIRNWFAASSVAFIRSMGNHFAGAGKMVLCRIPRLLARGNRSRNGLLEAAPLRVRPTARSARRSSSFWRACATARLLLPWPVPSPNRRRTSRTPRPADGASSSLSRPRPRSKESATPFRSSAHRNWPRPRAARSRGPRILFSQLLPRRTRDSPLEQHLHRQVVAPHRGVDGGDVPLPTSS